MIYLEETLFRGKPISIAGWASGTPSYSREGVGGDVAEGLMARLANNAYEMAGDVKEFDWDTFDWRTVSQEEIEELVIEEVIE